MKKISIIRFLALFSVIALFVASCTKDKEEVKLDQQFTTAQVTDVTDSSAVVIGFVVAEGDGITERGACYAFTAHPTVDNNKVIYTDAITTAAFKVKLTGLKYTTTYYARAYVKNSAGTIKYGDEYSFTTAVAFPKVTTATVTDITSSSAVTGGAVIDSGGAVISERGICYSKFGIPTKDSLTIAGGSGYGAFVSTLSGLTGNTTYYVRAYATNSKGISYGSVLEFTTPAPTVASVLTVGVSNITGFTANCSANVTTDGGAAVTLRGVCFSTQPNPTIASTVVESGSGIGEFTAQLTGLEGTTTYYVKAFAQNSVGVAYGAELTFTTTVPIRKWFVPGNYVENSYPNSGFVNWTPASSPYIESTLTEPDKLEGYVYMSLPANQWKLTTQDNWNGTNYGDDNNSGVLDPSAANNIVSGAGYYKINVDASTLAYTAVATAWGVVGSATPGSWNTDSPLTYDPITQTWRGGVTCTAAEFKFRANNDWGYNYGGSDGTLTAGGANIPLSADGDYYFVLDLSNPNAYTYSVNMWGLIGSATPGGWTTDSNMTWSSADNCLVVTTDLVAGEVKFRANDDWAINLGGDINSLTQDGANIAIAEDGNYTIKLYLDGTAPHCTIVKN